MLQDALFSVYNAIIKASPGSREGLLDFFAMVVKRNGKRSGMQVSGGIAICEMGCGS